MSVVKVFKPRYRLATKLRTGKLVDVPVAVKRAEAAIAEIADKLLEAVDADIAAAELALAEYMQQPDAEKMQRIYDCGDRLAGIGAACGLRPLADAALGTCELLDGMVVTQRTDARAIAVHVAALRLLRQAGDQDTGNVLSGLARVRDRFADPG